MVTWGQCPKCRRHQAVDEDQFQQAVSLISRMFLKLKKETALEDFATIISRVDELAKEIWLGWESGAVAYQIVTTSLRNLTGDLDVKDEIDKVQEA